MANQLKVAKVLSIQALHAEGWSQRRIARELGIDRETVAKHLAEAAPSGPAGEGPEVSKPAKAPTGSAGDDDGSKPAKAPPGSRSLCAGFQAAILAKLEQGLSAQRIFQDLAQEQGFTGKYHSVRRYVARLKQSKPLPFRRIEVAPGQEAQIDFGRGAPIIDAAGRRRQTRKAKAESKGTGASIGLTPTPSFKASVPIAPRKRSKQPELQPNSGDETTPPLEMSVPIHGPWR